MQRAVFCIGKEPSLTVPQGPSQTLTDPPGPRGLSWSLAVSRGPLRSPGDQPFDPFGNGFGRDGRQAMPVAVAAGLAAENRSRAALQIGLHDSLLGTP